MGFQGQIRPSHSVREPGRRCHDAQRRRTRAPAVPTIFTRCVGLVCTSATSGTRILVMASQRRGSCRLAPVRGSRGSEKETVKVYILLARGIYTGSQCAAKKARGASGRALGRGGFPQPFTLSTENPDLASDPLTQRSKEIRAFRRYSLSSMHYGVNYKGMRPEEPRVHRPHTARSDC